MEQRVVFLWLGFFLSATIQASVTGLQPVSYFDFIYPPPLTAYVGDNVHLRFRVDFVYLNDHCYSHWIYPAGAEVRYVAGYCPNLFVNYCPFTPKTAQRQSALVPLPLDAATCYFDLIIPVLALHQTIAGQVSYHSYMMSKIKPKKCLYGEYQIAGPHFAVRVLPRPLSMALIPEQKGTANQPFYFDIKKWVNNYLENLQAGALPQLEVFPPEQDGLYFDAQQGAIVGKITKIGSYQFQIRATNALSQTESRGLAIMGKENFFDKPLFRDMALPPINPGQTYQVNLLDFIEYKKEHMIHDQVHFRFDSRYVTPAWLSIESGLILKGRAPENLGEGESIALVAHSNTGGDSLTKVFQLPLAEDEQLRPMVRNRQLSVMSGQYIHINMKKYIISGQDDTRVFIEESNPYAPWLHQSNDCATCFEGETPFIAERQIFTFIFRAASKLGGLSKPGNLLLQVEPEPSETAIKTQKLAPASQNQENHLLRQEAMDLDCNDKATFFVLKR